MDRLKAALREAAPSFWTDLALACRQAETFDELFALASLRKRALASGNAPPASTRERVAMIGAYTLSPLRELLTLLAAIEGIDVELYTGEYATDRAELLREGSALERFAPSIVLWLPSAESCRSPRGLLDPREEHEAAALAYVREVVAAAESFHARAPAEIVMTNFALPAHDDLGPLRARTLGSEWSFKKRVNLELGIAAPSFVHVCDVEFLANRAGALSFTDAGAWFESKQPGSPALLVALARELVHVMSTLRRPSKKVLVLDLDNTLWGGVIGEDGLSGIELGDTSPRGEAFKAFQAHVKTLAARGVLLAVCSKNDEPEALSPFERHPEMVLRREDIAAFVANWRPKSDNLAAIAEQLGLGVDSLVFVDDNPAEIELVRQLLPQVTCVRMGPDPADYVAQLRGARCFETRALTAEDLERSQQYRAETARVALATSTTDLDAYWRSLEMQASFRAFDTADLPRITQLINKSNQFNLTTRRRTEAEVASLIGHADYVTIATRLSDRFGDHGLIGAVIAHARGDVLEIDTWLMSCRVLERRVEHTTLVELARLALARGHRTLLAHYLRTPKNDLVSQLLPTLGFTKVSDTDYTLAPDTYRAHETRIAVRRRTDDPD